MTLISIPNVSEGADGTLIEGLADAVRSAGAGVLDVHSDPVHGRSVLTTAGTADVLVEAMVALAASARDSIDLRTATGVHPRVGALDVCPIVPFRAGIGSAVETARAFAGGIARETGIPVFLYGAAAEREATRELPDLRRGGLEGLIVRTASGLSPDRGTGPIDPRTGVVCVGARGPLIAFNVWIDGDVSVARSIASKIRTSGGGPPGIRALGMDMGHGSSQVSMNLTQPEITGIDDAFALIAEAASGEAARISATEIVGLVEERFLPDPNAEAARLLMRPGRSIESSLE